MTSPAIREKYDLEVMPISIRGKRLELYALSNWDAFVRNLEEKGEAYIREFPFWIKVWEASIVLADHLCQLGWDKQKQILEIGAGMGIAGLFLGAFGHRVTITDYDDDALQLLQMNVELNKLRHVLVKKLDWNAPDLDEKYDVICGSELLYRETFIEPLIRLLKEYLRPGGTAIFAHDARRMCLMKFIGMVPGRFEIQNTGKTLRGEDEVHKVLIHTLHLKE
jgi:predicted nicotinamide N-methyase